MPRIISLIFFTLLPSQNWAESTLLTIAPSDKNLKQVDLEWEPVEKATSYDIRLTPADGGKPILFTTIDHHIVKMIPSGAYQLQIRTYVKDLDISSPWSEAMPLEVVGKQLLPLNPEDQAIIENSSSGKQTVEFRWSPVEHVKNYTLTVWNEDAKLRPWVFTTTTTSKKLEVPGAQVYYWQVKFESSTEVTYLQEPQIFSFTLLGDKLIKPEIVKSVPPIETKLLTWRNSPGASKYRARLSFQYLDDHDWTLLHEKELPENSWLVGKLANGRYKLEVMASAPRRTHSDTASYEFSIKPSQSDLKAALAQTWPKVQLSDIGHRPKNLHEQSNTGSTR